MTDDEIEAVARGICVEQGLDPDGTVSHGYGETFTPAERAERGDFVPDICLYSPRWQLYRGQAAIAIATRRALARLEAE